MFLDEKICPTRLSTLPNSQMQKRFPLILPLNPNTKSPIDNFAEFMDLIHPKEELNFI